jgi:hypothetical protein
MNLLRLSAVILAICTAQISSAQTEQKEVVRYYNNFITKLAAYDTSWIEDPETEEYKIIITHRKGIQSLNDLNVYAEDEADQPKVPATLENSDSYIRKLLAEELTILERYSFTDFSAEIIIDEKGRFAYFEPNRDIYFKGNKSIMCEVLDCIEHKLRNSRFIPAIAGGETVPYWINLTHSKSDISVVY